MAVCRTQPHARTIVIQILDIPHSFIVKSHLIWEDKSGSVFSFKKKKEECTQVGESQGDSLKFPTSNKA
jgi:hypothetical protein